MLNTNTNAGVFHAFTSLCKSLGALHGTVLATKGIQDTHEVATEALSGVIETTEDAAVAILEKHGATMPGLIPHAVESLSHRVLSMLPDRTSDRIGSSKVNRILWLKADPAYIRLVLQKGFTPGSGLAETLNCLSQRHETSPASADLIAELLCEHIAATDGTEIRLACFDTGSPYLAMFLRTQVSSESERARINTMTAAREAAMVNQADILAILHLAGLDLSDAFGFVRVKTSPAGRLRDLLYTNHGRMVLRQATGSLEEFIAEKHRRVVMDNLLT